MNNENGAVFSPCKTWRYALYRIWTPENPWLAVVGLNPSTADETSDDPTIRRCVSFAERHGYGGLTMLNLFAYRATAPRRMKAAEDPVGLENDGALRVYTSGIDVLCCWGTHGGFMGRDGEVLALLEGRRLFHLGLTLGRHPRHPLYLPKDTAMVEFDND